jgi:hypothetical protein
MKIALKDVSKQAVIKLDRSIMSKDDGVYGYVKFGDKNDYPQKIERLVNNSITAKSVSQIYSKFLAGRGFKANINNIEIGTDAKGKKITVLKLLRYVCDSIAMYNGAYVHTNVNLIGKVGSIRPILFKQVRFASMDDKGYIAKVGVYENWEMDPDNVTFGSKIFDKKKIRWYNLFNLNTDVISAQVKKVKGIEKYKGQVYFHFLDEQYIYPLSPFDSVGLDLDTEYQVSVFKNNMTRNGMTKKTVMRMVEPSTDEDERQLTEGVKKWQGADGENLLVVYDEIDLDTGEMKKSGAFALDSIDSNIEDKLFEGWQKDLSNNIRKAVKALPGILIDYEEGKLSTTSGESIIQATNFYNAMTFDDRASISEMFKELLSNFDNPVLENNINWEIQELSLYEPINVQSTTGN